ncbi:YHS domain-containing protein, partial [candidate division KSB1 bacterium]
METKQDRYQTDPVCGMTVDTSPSEGAEFVVYKGSYYYFCGGGCKVTFLRDPSAFLNPEEKGGTL